MKAGSWDLPLTSTHSRGTSTHSGMNMCTLTHILKDKILLPFLDGMLITSQAEWCIPVIPPLGKWNYPHCKVKTSLGCKKPFVKERREGGRAREGGREEKKTNIKRMFASHYWKLNLVSLEPDFDFQYPMECLLSVPTVPHAQCIHTELFICLISCPKQPNLFSLLCHGFLS